jgi:hypothetical protein
LQQQRLHAEPVYAQGMFRGLARVGAELPEQVEGWAKEDKKLVR